MGLDLSSTKAVWLPVALATLVGGGLYLASGSSVPSSVLRSPPSSQGAEDALPDAAQHEGASAKAPQGGTRRGPGTAHAKKTKAVAPAHLEKVVSAPWGNKLGELGHDLAQEGAAIGPASFVVDQQGAIHVLDTVNSRVAVFERGVGSRSVRLPLDTFQDLDFHGKGYVLLDPFTSASLAFADETGHVRREVSLLGEGVPEAGLVTGLFSRADGSWVEVGHDYLMRIADAAGAPVSTRRRAEGRFVGTSEDTVEAMAQKPWGAKIVRHERGEEIGKDVVQQSFSLPLLSLTGLEGTADGTVYLGAKLHEDELVAPFAIQRVEHWIIAYDADGIEKDRVRVPEQEGPEEMFREMKLGRDGAIYAWTFTEQGVDIYRRQP